MNRRLWPSALLAALSFGLALSVGFKDPKDQRIGEAWTQIEAANIRSLRFTAPEKAIEILPLGGSSAWVKHEEKGKTEEFLAGPRIRDLYFALSPIWASRKLGTLSAKKKEDYGFAGDPKLLRIELRDGPAKEFQLGSRGFQSSDYFTLDRTNQKVFLWNREAPDLIQDPARLMMKELHFFNPEGINSIGIERPGHKGTRELIKSGKVWTERGKPVSPEDTVFPWLERLAKLAIKAYRTRPGEPSNPWIHMVLRTESEFDIRIFYEEASAATFLDFGAGKPQILLDSEAIRPLQVEWEQGKISAKN